MNRCILIGRLTKDPELRTTSSGISVTTFTVAVDRSFGKDKETDFIPVVTWRGLADNCAKFLSKGKKVAVSGRIQTRSYETQNGDKRYVTEIIADDVEFLTPKSEAHYEPDSEFRDGLNDPPETEFDGDDFEPLDDEQMPF